MTNRDFHFKSFFYATLSLYIWGQPVFMKFRRKSYNKTRKKTEKGTIPKYYCQEASTNDKESFQ